MTITYVGVDIGGTFTDLVYWDGGRYHMAKTPSTPPEFAQGMLNGLDQLFPNRDLGHLDYIMHGTTAGLNAFLERRGALTALLTTQGFRDVYEIGRMNRTDMYNIFFRKPERLTPRHRIYEVPERIMADGQVRRPLDTEALGDIIQALKQDKVASIAVCLIHGYKNPIHEQQVKAILERELPGVSVSVSHEVAPEWREYERTSSTVINAYITPIMEGYLAELERGLIERGFKGRLYIMQSNGGVMSTTAARSQAIRTLMSGPVGGAVGSEILAEQIKEPHLICADMGGTSFDVSLIQDGKSEVRTHVVMEGFPILAPMVAVHSIGAGGGSIARAVDGALRVGPVSAGARPGPACYGHGGVEPTVTDANLVLGRIDSDYFLGGAMRLEATAAETAMGRLSRDLGLDPFRLAEGILRVVNAKMANAIRTITVSRGIDPRRFALVAFGGAGPMHAAFLAEELDIPRVIVPAFPGAYSAWGMLHTDIRLDLVHSYFQAFSRLRVAEIEDAYQVMQTEGRQRLLAEGASGEHLAFYRTADVRYLGQEFFLNIPLAPTFGTEALRQLPSAFHRAYEIRYGHATPTAEIEVVNLRLRAVGQLQRQALPPPDTQVEAKVHQTRRRVYFDGEWYSCAVYRRASLPIGFTFTGPSIIEEPACTTVVPGGFSGLVDDYGNLILNRR